MTDKRFGNRFKACRESQGLTQEDLAAKTQLSVQYISYVERGQRYPRFDKLIILLNGLGISADDVFCDVVEKSMDQRSSYLSEKLMALPADEKTDILDLFEFLIQQATKRAKKSGTIKRIDKSTET